MNTAHICTLTLKYVYHDILFSCHIAATLCVSSLTHVELINNQIRLKKSNRETALLCVSTTETKVKETITLGNQKVKKKKKKPEIRFTNEQAFPAEGLLKVIYFSCETG